ncbi:MAG: FAD-dependent oxidoreductase [Proteobacteria bacterium]|nr:FAD-dependent oxidoreductase [Pseudomonadota bacterium]
MRLVVIGSGIASHAACRYALEISHNIEIIVISKDPLPLYSPCLLPYYVAGEISRDRLFIRGDYSPAMEHVSFMTDTKIVEIDPPRKLLILNQGTFSYDRLILALGGHGLTPPFTGIHLPGVFQFKTLNDVDSLMKWPGKRVVVVGSGPIGVEAAVALNMRGMKVCLIELANRLLPAILDDYPASIVQSMLTEAGIEVMVGERVQSLAGKDRVEAVLTTKSRIPADMVVFAVGVSPSIDIAEKAGVKIGKTGGIATDISLKTSDPSIWACGDCIESRDLVTGLPVLNMLWPNAVAQGSVAGINAVGGKKLYHGSFSFIVVNMFNTFVFSFGPTSQSMADCTATEIKSSKGYIRLLTKDMQLIGAQIISDDSWTGITSAILNHDRGLLLPNNLKRSLIFQAPRMLKLMRAISNPAN